MCLTELTFFNFVPSGRLPGQVDNRFECVYFGIGCIKLVWCLHNQLV